MRSAWTSTPPSSSNPITSPIATSNTRGEVMARHEPRTCTVKSPRAEPIDEPPNDLPTITVTAGTRCVRLPLSGDIWAPVMPTAPRMSGMRAPPVSPRSM